MTSQWDNENDAMQHDVTRWGGTGQHNGQQDGTLRQHDARQQATVYTNQQDAGQWDEVLWQRRLDVLCEGGIEMENKTTMRRTTRWIDAMMQHDVRQDTTINAMETQCERAA